MGAEVADPPAVARHCKVYAVRLGKVCHQAACSIGKLGVQVKVIAAALGTELLDGRVDDRQPVRRKAGQRIADLLLRGGQDRLHIECRVRQRRAQLVQHFAVVGQKAVIVAGLDQRVGADEDIQLGGLGGGQHIQRDLLAAVGA